MWSELTSDRVQRNGKTDPPIYALIATTRFLLLLNLSTKQVIPLEFHRPEYYGVSWFPDSPHLVVSHSNLDNASLTSLSEYAASEVGTLTMGDIASPAFLSQPHQLICVPDGRVICTNTGRNAITVFDFNCPNTFQEVRVSASRWDRLSLQQNVGDHLNSVFLKGDRLYTIAHGFSKGSKLIEFSYPTLETVSIEPIRSCTGMHNIWITDAGERICCNSETGSLINIRNGQVLWCAGSPIFTRGLAATADIVLVGESQKLGRDLRHSSMSGLWLIDRNTWSTLDYYCLGPYGSVHEVRLLNAVDEAHHGLPFSGLAALLKQDAREELASTRIQASRQSQRDQTAWSEFHTVYGEPVAGENNSRSIEPGRLCLLIQPGSAGKKEWEMNFRYSIDPAAPDAHVSVVNYRGHGGDTDMQALLIQRQTDCEGTLSKWCHDGNDWRQEAGVGIRGLPLRAKAKVALRGSLMELTVNDKPIVSVPVDAGHEGNGVLGLRFAGATVYPNA